LRLQDPGASTGYLLEVLLTAAQAAERGGGIFAFATADGLRAVLSDEAFGGLLQSGEFVLVVGVDLVTDERALDELAAFTARYPGLTARVFVHDESVLFHPKLAWFKVAADLILIVGSGNLTVRGLRENWEAFTTITLSGAAADATEQQLDDWLEDHAPLLLPMEHATVRERAARNTGRERDLKHPRSTVATDLVPLRAEALVAETPKSGTRPSQVNFHKDHYEGFFGAKAGTGRRVILRAVGADGTVGEEEVRPSSARESQNFSFELAAFRGSEPADEPPVIGVYVRLPQGSFLYQRVAPDEGGYADLARFLDERWTGRDDFMRQIQATVREVRNAWADSPLWTAEVPSA
jgi:hypothetical protein